LTAEDPLLKQLRSPDWGEQLDAVREALAEEPLETARFNALVEILPHAEEPVRLEVARGLSRLDGEQQITLGTLLLEDASRQIRTLTQKTLRAAQRVGARRRDPEEVRARAERLEGQVGPGPRNLRGAQRLAAALFERAAHEFAHDYRKRNEGAIECLRALADLLAEAQVDPNRYHLEYEAVLSTLLLGRRHCLELLDRANPTPPAASQFEARDLVAQVIRTLASEQGSVDVQNAVPNGLFMFQVEDSIRRVLENLLGNVFAEADASRVEVRGRLVDPGTIRIEVEDDAGGIPERVRHRIWEPLFSTRRWVDSTHAGQGLATVDHLVSEHCRGHVDVEHLPEGSCFWFEIPLELPQ